MMLAKVFRIVGYFTSILLFVLGLILLTGGFGFFGFGHLPGNFKVIFGIVFMLYGIYRFVRLKYVGRDNNNEED